MISRSGFWSPAVIGSLIGSVVAFGLIILVIRFGSLSYTPLPESSQPADSWNVTGIRASFKDIEADHGSLIFSYVIDNDTDYDYLLSDRSAIVFGERLKDIKSSSGRTGVEALPIALIEKTESIESNLPIFLASHQRALFTIKALDPSTSKFPTKGIAEGRLKDDAKRTALELYRQKLTEYLNNETDLNGFVLFDYSKHYRIEFPNGWQKP